MQVTDFPRPSGRRPSRLCILLLALPAVPASQAGQTRTWTQSEYADFEKGIIRNLSLRSDGLVTLAPRFREVFDSGASYLWAVAQDSKGNLFAGGGPGARLFRIGPKGERKTLAELDGLEVHAIAIDKQDRVYVGTSPDGKVYRVTNGKSEVFYNPNAKYVWALAFDSRGDLLVATGDQGQVHRVKPDGKGSVFFPTDETHVRSMIVDAHDNLILGTDPSGLILRVSPDGRGFVLYQMGKKEITAVGMARDGSVYAAGVGNKGASGSSVAPSLAPPPQVPLPAPTGGSQVTLHAAPVPPPVGVPPLAAVPGGSELYRIDLNGNPRRVWSHPRDIIYAIGFDPAGKVLLGTGNKGYIYRIESDTLYTALLNAPPTQITSFYEARDGRLFAATSNVGKVFEVGPGAEPEGSLESDIFDSGMYSVWGRLSFEAVLNGGDVSLSARSGNLDQPQKNWSSWSAPVTSTKGARLNVPPARFVQWKAVLKSTESGHSPQLESVDVAYLPKNVAPRVEEIEITPVNYRFPPPPALPSQPSQTLNLPPLGKHPQGGGSVPLDTTVTPSMQYAKGFIGARWTASDDNGDSLIYTVLIRGVRETTWKPLKDKVREKYVAWDSTSFPDGEYRLRIIASDLPGNPPAEALVSSADSEPFLIDNTPPRIAGLAAAIAGGKLTARWKAVDSLNNIKRAEYSLDGGDWTLVAPTSLLSDSPEEDYELVIDNLAPGEHTIAVRVQDAYDNESTDKAVVK
jgi:sugar lactone lactonase YvrE